MNSTSLSIITVNLNSAAGLRRTIESVISQTFTDYEFIVIDGGSTDGSVDVIHEYEDRVDYWVSEPDNGIYNAMNKGIKVAKGVYLNFLNSGDYFVNKSVLETVLNKLPNCDLVYGNHIVIRSDGRYILRKPFISELNIRTFINGTINHQAAFIHQKLFQLYGLYDESLRLAADWKFFFIAVGINKSKTIYKDVNIVYYEQNGLSYSNYNLWELEKNDYLKSALPLTVIEFFQKYDKDIVRIIHIRSNKITSRIYRLIQIVLVRIASITNKLFLAIQHNKHGKQIIKK